MDNFKSMIGHSPVSVCLGDLTQYQVDAYLVPHYDDAHSDMGVGGAVARAGAEAGIKAYGDCLLKDGKKLYGQVTLMESGGGNAPYLLHAATIDSRADNEFQVIQTAIFGALNIAADQGLKSVAVPALGTGAMGALTSRQSAMAMMSGVEAYAHQDEMPIDISFVIWGDQDAFKVFKNVLSSGAYVEALPEAGSQEIDLFQLAQAMDEESNKNAAVLGHEMLPIVKIDKDLN